MKIKEWFKNGRDYNDGVALYASLKGYSQNLHRLFLRKYSAANAAKLEYEMSKHLDLQDDDDDEAVVASQMVNAVKDVGVVGISEGKNLNDFVVKKASQWQGNKKWGGFYRLNELHLDLHPLAIKQRNDYQMAISYHSQLTALHPDEEGKALGLGIKIEDLFDAIETAQKVLDHYVHHKVVIDISPRTYEDYTGGQLADARRNKRTSITKYKKRVAMLEDKIRQNLSKSEHNKVTRSLENASKKLLSHELDLTQLNELINGQK